MSSLTAAWYSTEYNEISTVVNNIMNSGFSAEQIVSQVLVWAKYYVGHNTNNLNLSTKLFLLTLQMHDHLVTDPELSSYQKSKISLILGEADLCLINGADEHLQILNIMLQTADIVTH
jgi:replication factor C subunit 2/4